MLHLVDSVHSSVHLLVDFAKASVRFSRWNGLCRLRLTMKLKRIGCGLVTRCPCFGTRKSTRRYAFACLHPCTLCLLYFYILIRPVIGVSVSVSVFRLFCFDFAVCPLGYALSSAYPYLSFLFCLSCLVFVRGLCCHAIYITEFKKLALGIGH